MTFRSILVPTDFSPDAAAALETAAELASRFQAKLTVIHAYLPPGLVMPDGYMGPPPAILRDLIDAIEKSLAELRARTERPGLTVTTQAIQGNPVHEICEAARQGEHDLIVMGTQGRTGLKHLLLGSVAEKVVRHAPCPVLVVRSKGALPALST